MKTQAKKVARKVVKRAARRVDDLLNPLTPAVYTGQLVMGRHSYYRPKVLVYPGDTNRCIIGSFTSIAADCTIFVGGEHRMDWVAIYGLRQALGLPGALQDGNPISRGDVVIGNDCWIGLGSWIRSGVTIGDGAIVGFASVVTKDIGPYEIWTGNPARFIRKRFTDHQVEALLRIKWWNWTDEQIVERVGDLNGATVEEFIAKYDPGT